MEEVILLWLIQQLLGLETFDELQGFHAFGYLIALGSLLELKNIEIFGDLYCF